MWYHRGEYFYTLFTNDLTRTPREAEDPPPKPTSHTGEVKPSDKGQRRCSGHGKYPTYPQSQRERKSPAAKSARYPSAYDQEDASISSS